MSNLPQTLLPDGTLATGAAALLYRGTITTAALVAMLAPSQHRRRAAREVLTILPRRRSGPSA